MSDFHSRFPKIKVKRGGAPEPVDGVCAQGPEEASQTTGDRRADAGTAVARSKGQVLCRWPPGSQSQSPRDRTRGHEVPAH